MRNVLNFMAAMLLMTLLFAAQRFPASPLFWVASLAPVFTVLRYALVVVLLWFIIHPPKTKLLRVPLGLATFVLAAWLADTTYQGSMGFIDFLTLGTATLALFITLLDSKPKNEEFASMRFLTAIFSWLSDRVWLAASWAFQFNWLLMTDIELILEEYIHHINKEWDIEFANSQRHMHV